MKYLPIKTAPKSLPNSFSIMDGQVRGHDHSLKSFNFDRFDVSVAIVNDYNEPVSAMQKTIDQSISIEKNVQISSKHCIE